MKTNVPMRRATFQQPDGSHRRQTVGSLIFRRPMLWQAWLLSSITALLVVALPSPSTAQEPPAAGPAINLSEMMGGALGRMLNPTSAPASENLPPPVEHLIPIKADAAPDTILVDNQAGLVRLVVRDAPLRQVLALLAESQKLNLVFATAAEARITVSLDRVPLSVALDAILSSVGHTWTRRGDIIHITPIDSPVALGPSVQGRQMQVFELDYASAIDVDLGVKALLSPIGKSWVVSSSPTNNRQTKELVAVEDLPEYVDRIANYISQTDFPPRQVMVEVQILQVDLENTLNHGVNFAELGRLGGPGISFSSTGLASRPTSSDGDSSGSSKQAFFFEALGGDLSSLVELLETTNDAKTLASPKLLAVNGQESRIQIGRRLPYRNTTTTQTSTQESVEFLEVGVVLSFTPSITRDGRVLMHVSPKVSDGAVNENTGLPEESTTEVQADVFLADGEGVVIGGLISERDSINQSKLPVLGDIPYAGALFQRRAVQRKRSEIIVALMPHLLPYNCPQQQINDQEVTRARDPLVYGPLNRYPRPYEPRLPDAVEESRRDWDERFGQVGKRGPQRYAPQPMTVQPLPCPPPGYGPPLAGPRPQPAMNQQPPVQQQPIPDQQARSMFAPPAMQPQVARRPNPGGPVRR